MKRVLFVCVHNAGRSQMAEAFLRELAKEKGLDVDSVSAGTVPGDIVNPVAVEAMKEIGISMEDQNPKVLSQELADSADIVVTMGCGVDTESCPAMITISEDWGLSDPAGQGIDSVREIRDEIKNRVEELLETL